MLGEHLCREGRGRTHCDNGGPARVIRIGTPFALDTKEYPPWPGMVSATGQRDLVWSSRASRRFFTYYSVSYFAGTFGQFPFFRLCHFPIMSACFISLAVARHALVTSGEGAGFRWTANMTKWKSAACSLIGFVEVLVRDMCSMLSTLCSHMFLCNTSHVFSRWATVPLVPLHSLYYSALPRICR